MSTCRIAAMAFLAGALAVSAQTLVNPSFEVQGEQQDLAEGWSRWGNWMNREVGWTPRKDGDAIIGYHHWQIEQGDNSGLYQDVKATPGRRYVFRIYANSDPVRDDSVRAQSVEMRLEATVNGQQSTVASRKYELSDLSTGDDWSQLMVEGTAPNEDLRVLVIVHPAKDGSRGGAVKFDKASLEADD